MTWTSCFNVNAFVSSSYLLIRLLSFLENPGFAGSFSRKSWLRPDLFHRLMTDFSFSLEMKIVQKKFK